MAWPRRIIQEVIMVVAALALTFAFVRLISALPERDTNKGPALTLSELCEWESRFMESQAARCRAQAVQGVPFDLDNEFCEMLKVCPYVVDDRDEETWEAQARVWDRAAARSLEASRRARPWL